MAANAVCKCGTPCADDDTYMDDLANVFCGSACLLKYGQFYEDWRDIPEDLEDDMPDPIPLEANPQSFPCVGCSHQDGNTCHYEGEGEPCMFWVKQYL